MKDRLVWVGGLILLGCAAPEPQPHDASQAQHEEDARRHEEGAEDHAARFDPGAARAHFQCKHDEAAGEWNKCWTWEANPTEQHLRHAEALREAAEKHRAAAEALRQAESTACSGLRPVDRDMSPFDHKEDVLTVEPLAGKGATITLRAVDGLTEASLQRIVSCHLARNAAMGHAFPEMQFCPLAVKGASATVAKGAEGLKVTVVGSDDTSAREIGRRAASLPAATGR